MQISDLKFLSLLTIEGLKNWCTYVAVYAVVDEHGATPMYGRVGVKEGRVTINRFKPTNPQCVLIPFKDLLSRFGENSELPKTGFLQVMPVGGGSEDSFEIAIETEDLSHRGRNFILLCSYLKGISYAGLTMKGYSSVFQLYPCPPNLVEEITGDKSKTLMKEADVYGIWDADSRVGIVTKNSPTISTRPKFGVVVAGFQTLKNKPKGKYVVTECGIVI